MGGRASTALKKPLPVATSIPEVFRKTDRNHEVAVSTNAKRRYEWMWSQAVELADEAARLHRRFLRYQGPAEGAVSWEPPVDVHEGDDGGLTLNFALPGVAPENIEIRLERNAVTVSALRAP